MSFCLVLTIKKKMSDNKEVYGDTYIPDKDTRYTRRKWV